MCPTCNLPTTEHDDAESKTNPYSRTGDIGRFREVVCLLEASMRAENSEPFLYQSLLPLPQTPSIAKKLIALLNQISQLLSHRRKMPSQHVPRIHP